MANRYTATTYVTDTHAQCSDCGEIKEHDQFHTVSVNKHRKGCSYYCKECACNRARKNHAARVEKDPTYKEQKRSIYFKHKYGITLQQYQEKLAQQDNSCAICGLKLPTSGSFTHLDHDHKTGTLRAFLCTNCNRALGHFQDSIPILESAIRYLNTHTVNENTGKEVCQ